MSEEDKELERLKAKRLSEMEKNISYKRQEQQKETQHQQQGKNSYLQDPKKKKLPSPREIILQRLGYRGLEVLENAEFQFPNETKIIVEKLAELINSGEINEQIDGGKLLALFRSVGLNIRMQTKINVKQDGELVSLSDKLSYKSSSSSSSINEEQEDSAQSRNS